MRKNTNFDSHVTNHKHHFERKSTAIIKIKSVIVAIFLHDRRLKAAAESDGYSGDLRQWL